jgi:hypothetical protein
MILPTIPVSVSDQIHVIADTLNLLTSSMGILHETRNIYVIWN